MDLINEIIGKVGKPELTKKILISGLGVEQINKSIFLVFQSSADKKKEFRVAKSTDGFNFELVKKIADHYKNDKSDEKLTELIKPRADFFDSGKIEIEGTVKTGRGKLVFYHSCNQENECRVGLVYTVIHSGRDEEIEDERHLRQFRLTEEEFDCSFGKMDRKNYDEEKMFRMLLIHIQKAIQSMIKAVLEDNEEILKTVYGRNIKSLEKTATSDFLEIDYESAVKLLNKNGFPELKFGDDMKARHEAKVVALLNKNKNELPVFITKYPKEIKFFNMKVSEKDPRVVLSADLILPFSGESTGAAVREHDYKKLKERLLTSTMYQLHLKRGGTLDDFKWYLDIIKSEKANPHAGYGIGNERVMQYIFRTSDIRKISLFTLLNK